jgi:hypothetical protein
MFLVFFFARAKKEGPMKDVNFLHRRLLQQVFRALEGETIPHPVLNLIPESISKHTHKYSQNIDQ